jgi:hypothetical protein
MSSVEIAHLHEKCDTALRHTAEHTEQIGLLKQLRDVDAKRTGAISDQLDMICNLVFAHLGLPPLPDPPEDVAA